MVALPVERTDVLQRSERPGVWQPKRLHQLIIGFSLSSLATELLFRPAISLVSEREVHRSVVAELPPGAEAARVGHV